MPIHCSKRAGIYERNEREQHAGDDRAGPENIPKIGALQRLALRSHRRGGALRRDDAAAGTARAGRGRGAAAA